MADNHSHPCNRLHVVAIDVLPDDVLLSIFDFYMVQYRDFPKIVFQETNGKIQSWQSLVHVCRRWRGLIFGSPRRLNLQICCPPRTSARMSRDVWPALPLIIMGGVSKSAVDNVIAELEHRDRISKIGLIFLTTSQIEDVWAAMQEPFPELKSLFLSYPVQSCIHMVPALPDSFLGGSAPCLQFFGLDAVPFPGLSKLLLSASHLVSLSLHDVPHSGYISPEAMATCLSMLTRLEALQLEFESPQSCPDQENRRSPLPTRTILPALTSFRFKGVNEYLEDLVSWIDSPRLHLFSITFFNDIDFNTSEFNQFISRTPTFGAYNEASLIFGSRQALVRLQSYPGPSDHRMVEVKISCQASDWQLSSLAQICTLSLHLFSAMENLHIYENPNSRPNWNDNIENTEWLELLLPFTGVKDLYLSKQFSPRIVPALRELRGGSTIEVLPALQNVFLEGFQPSEPVEEGIAQFISVRQLANHPITVSVWDRHTASGS